MDFLRQLVPELQFRRRTNIFYNMLINTFLTLLVVEACLAVPYIPAATTALIILDLTSVVVPLTSNSTISPKRQPHSTQAQSSLPQRYSTLTPPHAAKRTLSLPP